MFLISYIHNNEIEKGESKLIENENDRDCEKGCEPRLKECEKEICGICDDVKQTFCCDPVERKEDEDSYAD